MNQMFVDWYGFSSSDINKKPDIFNSFCSCNVQARGETLCKYAVIQLAWISLEVHYIPYDTNNLLLTIISMYALYTLFNINY